MRFSEKLDYLMKVTNTTNSALASSTSLDASYISRLRRGVRNLPKNENYVPLMADYFAKHCSEEYQTKALRECIPPSYPVSNDQSENSRSIMRWLKEDDDHPSNTVQGFLDILEDFQFKKPHNWSQIESADHIETKKSLVSIHYGFSGKQEATLAFLRAVINCNKPQTLLLRNY